MNLSEIKISNRHRKDMGDIDALAASMEQVGMLHPIVVDAEGNLICGERRYAAAKKLGWRNVPTAIAENIDDVQAALMAERDENTCRKAFTPTEAAAMADALEPFEKKAAKEREEAGRGRPPKEKGENFTPISNAGKSRDKVAAAVGMSSPTLTKARVVAKAAKDHPEDYGDLAEAMDLTGKVSPAYDELAKRVAEPERPKVELPIAPTPKPQFASPHPREQAAKDPSVIWTGQWHEIYMKLNSIRDMGGIGALLEEWTEGQRQEYASECRRVAEILNQWADSIETTPISEAA